MGTVEKIPATQESEKTRLRALISELSERLVESLDHPEGKEPSEGKETAKFSDIKECLNTILSVYRTLNNSGDLDEDQGSAITAYGKELANGRRGPSRR